MTGTGHSSRCTFAVRNCAGQSDLIRRDPRGPPSPKACPIDTIIKEAVRPASFEVNLKHRDDAMAAGRRHRGCCAAPESPNRPHKARAQGHLQAKPFPGMDRANGMTCPCQRAGCGMANNIFSGGRAICGCPQQRGGSLPADAEGHAAALYRAFQRLSPPAARVLRTDPDCLGPQQPFRGGAGPALRRTKAKEGSNTAIRAPTPNHLFRAGRRLGGMLEALEERKDAAAGGKWRQRTLQVARLPQLSDDMDGRHRGFRSSPIIIGRLFGEDLRRIFAESSARNSKAFDNEITPTPPHWSASTYL